MRRKKKTQNTASDAERNDEKGKKKIQRRDRESEAERVRDIQDFREGELERACFQRVRREMTDESDGEDGGSIERERECE